MLRNGFRPSTIDGTGFQLVFCLDTLLFPAGKRGVTVAWPRLSEWRSLDKRNGRSPAGPREVSGTLLDLMGVSSQEASLRLRLPRGCHSLRPN